MEKKQTGEEKREEKREEKGEEKREGDELIVNSNQ